jgi:hypothetical protein
MHPRANAAAVHTAPNYTELDENGPGHGAASELEVGARRREISIALTIKQACADIQASCLNLLGVKQARGLVLHFCQVRTRHRWTSMPGRRGEKRAIASSTVSRPFQRQHRVALLDRSEPLAAAYTGSAIAVYNPRKHRVSLLDWGAWLCFHSMQLETRREVVCLTEDGLQGPRLVDSRCWRLAPIGQRRYPVCTGTRACCPSTPP